MAAIDNISIKENGNQPVLDFISGKTETAASKRLTKNIHNIRSLWILAKMVANVRKRDF